MVFPGGCTNFVMNVTTQELVQLQSKTVSLSFVASRHCPEYLQSSFLLNESCGQACLFVLERRFLPPLGLPR